MPNLRRLRKGRWSRPWEDDPCSEKSHSPADFGVKGTDGARTSVSFFLLREWLNSEGGSRQGRQVLAAPARTARSGMYSAA